ncbi:MAG: hypothetical protein JXR18_14095 [Neptuniibacter sp.]
MLKGKFEERKYHPEREWEVKRKERKNKITTYLKHESGKNVPISVMEIIKHLVLWTGIILQLDRPENPMIWRILPILMTGLFCSYLFRQLKIKQFKKIL